ncbi:hypothetical protein ANANG_G00207770 [Anguilla anguilla]|uniref:PH domain-containing protein n=1 Tax=Anguilla anguilla TaxID=7936 RepID=A0A9D3LZ74_ANGAN|nr:hypothetical protein ANANG_G00207770 [Anguilla anguilla]
MEDGVKGATSEPGKVGWVKKSSGKLLGSYKERYIKVEKTEMVVFKNQELQTCLERVDLEKYDKCLELRSTFKKKSRLVLIQAPNCGSKVHNVKLQVENSEEKEAWIKALNDAINRAKNKIFDEVKVDESCSLDHVTQSRPRGNRSRRPPTRIHLKEVASASSDGILRLDLDTAEHTPNGTHELSAATVEVTDIKTDHVPKPPVALLQPSEGLQETLSEEGMTDPIPPLKESKLRVLEEEDTSAGTTADSGSEPVATEKPTESSGLPATPNMKSLKVLAVSDQSCDHWEGSVQDPASSEETIIPLERLGVLSEETGCSPSMGQEDIKSKDSGQRSHDGADSLEEDGAGSPPHSIPTPVGDLMSSEEEQRPNVDELRSRVAHELQTTQELLGEVCQGEGRGLVPEDLLMKAAKKFQLAQLCLRQASTLKLCEPPSRKDKRTSW